MFGWLFLGSQVFMIICYGCFTKYGHSAAADVANSVEATAEVAVVYGLYQDVHVMIFIGFGFLMTFLRKYGFGAVSFTLMLGAFCIQWSALLHGFFAKLFDGNFDEKIELGLHTLVEGDFAAAAVLISFGAIIGKCSPTQYFLMAVIETVLYALNFQIGALELKAVDVGGTMFIHLFGAYFGLAVSLVVSPPRGKGHAANSSVYNSDIFSMVGTVFLWVFWPSFVAVLVTGSARVRVLIHTVFAISSSCAGAFATSSIMRHKKRFDMVDVQNATLAGGVAIGAIANMTIGAYGAMIVGLASGILSTVGYVKIQGFLEESRGKFWPGLQDTCGVHNLHGMPGAFGAIASFFAVLWTGDYGEHIGDVFPDIGNGDRSRGEQAGYQLAAFVITMLIAIVGGLATGWLMTLLGQTTYLFNDYQYFSVPDDFKNQDEQVSMAPKKKKKASLKRMMSVAQRGVRYKK